MRDSTIARNYAEALISLAAKANDTEGWGTLITEVADAVEGDVRLSRFLESPKVSAAQKIEVLSKAFQDRMPRFFVRFLQALVTNRRQMLLPEIAQEYRTLLDESQGRVHASVTVARALDESGERMIAEQLSRVFSKKVVPHITVNPALLGGIIVKVGDTVMDGSVRKRLATLRSQIVGVGMA